MAEMLMWIVSAGLKRKPASSSTPPEQRRGAARAYAAPLLAVKADPERAARLSQFALQFLH
jgi:hypothetical protein